MNNSEITAFNSVVLTVLELAKSTAATMESLTVLKPTRFNFAAEALRALSEEGRELLKGDVAPFSGVERVGSAHAGKDGNFGLTDAEIIRPSRSVIIGWLTGRYPMLASHWSKIAARMLQKGAAASLEKHT